MRLDFCAVCGSTEDLQHHHFTPRIEGGIDDETNIMSIIVRFMDNLIVIVLIMLN